MDEIDKVIIGKLKLIDCPVEEINDFGDFTHERFTETLINCIKQISNNSQLPSTIPKSAIQTMNLAVMLTDYLKNDLKYPYPLQYYDLLYFDNNSRKLLMFLIDKISNIHDNSNNIHSKNSLLVVNTNTESYLQNNEENSAENKQKLQELKLENEFKNRNIFEFKEEISYLRKQLKQICQEKNSIENNMNSTLSTIKIKTQTLKLLENKDEMIQKLRNIVRNDEQKLENIRSKWYAIEKSLLHKLEDIQSQNITKHMKLCELQSKKSELNNELNEKQISLSILQKGIKKWSEIGNRSLYTMKVMEIVRNLEKQSLEIEKTLNDINSIQKDIVQLEAQLHRLFKICDDFFLNDTKKNNIAQVCYDLLLTLHDDCAAIYHTIERISFREREIMDLKQYIDNEQRNNIKQKLEKATKDLKQFQYEVNDY